MSDLNQHLKFVIEYISNYIGTISQEEQTHALKLIQFSSYKKGDLIFEQGKIPQKVSFLLKGAVRSYYLNEDGKENTVSFHFGNEPLLPYASFVEQVPSGTSMVAINTVEMIYVNRKDFYTFLDTYPRYEIVIGKLLAKYMLKRNDQLKLLRIESSRERYEKLLQLNPEILNQVPLKYIASYLGMAVETVSRIRAGKL